MVVCMSRRICVELYREIVGAAAGLASRGRRPGRAQGGDDRLGVRPAGLAAAHPQQAAARGAGAALPRPEGPVPDRHRARHVADRLRRAEPAHDVRGQADARARADAGHRPGQPRVQGQAGRAGGGLPGAGRRAQAGARDLHRERRHRQDGASTRPRPWPSCWRSTRSAAGSSTASTGRRGSRARRRSACRCCRPRRSTSSRQEDGKSRLLRAVTELSQAFALAVPHEEALRIRDDVGFFQAVRAVLAKSTPGERQDRRGARPRHPADRLEGGGLRRGRGHLRRGRAQEAGHLDPLRRVPGRGARHAAAEPGRRAAAEAAEGRDQDAARSATWCRRAPSPSCWSRRCASTRTGPSRRPR